MLKAADSTTAGAVPIDGGAVRRRRSRILRSVALIVLMTAAFVAIVVVLRNNSRLTEARERFEKALAGLKQTYERTGVLPRHYSAEQSTGSPLAASTLIYMDDEMARFAGRLSEPTIIAYTPSIRMALAPNKRFVALREGRTIRVEEMSGNQFNDHYNRQKLQAEQATETPAGER